jgi:hypothetical protein
MAAANPYPNTSSMDTKKIGHEVTSMMKLATTQRRSWERRWYDNNFFDDGYHFRFISRTTNRVIDLSSKEQNTTSPMRAIPKASRQIRGMANLLMSGNFVPVVRPVKVNKANYIDDFGQFDEQGYLEARELAKTIAKRSGHWIQEQFKQQQIHIKLAEMLINTMKHRVSWLQVYPDYVEEKIKTQDYDNFDLYYIGNLNDIEDSPFVIKACPKLISEIKANEYFDKDQLKQITPDNKYASSEIKQAYLQSKMGTGTPSDSAATLILKEAYIKEYLDEFNMAQIREQEDGDIILKGKKKGDPVIRQVFVAGDVWLRDTYTSLPGYPFVPLMLEPGPLYGIAPIERFIPQNKSLDVAVSRVERYFNSMVVGNYLKRKGESFELSNRAGANVIEYEGTPPVQQNIAPLPAFVFNFLGLLESFIEEQGVTTTALGKLPKGVKANAAIETLKESEFSNLKIAIDQIKLFLTRVAEKMLDIADNYFVTPQNVERLNKGEPDYFDVIGKSALSSYKRIKKELPDDVVPLSKDYGVEIEVESGLGFTAAGKREGAKEIMDLLNPYITGGIIPSTVLKPLIEKTLETYQYGNTAEIAEELDRLPDQGSEMTEKQIEQMKIAVAEVLKDIGFGQQQQQEQMIETTKIGVVEALKDTGLIDGKPENAREQAEIAKIEQEMRLKEEEHDLKMAQLEQEIEIKDEKAEIETEIKKVQATQDMSIKERQTEQQMKVAEKMAKNASKPQKGSDETNSKRKRNS